MRKTIVAAGLSLMLGAWILAGHVWAGEITYQPINPAFGGSPLNASFLLGAASAQNGFKDPSASSSLRSRSSGQTFQQRVDSLVLNSIARQLLGNLTDPVTGNLIPGIINTGVTTITITDIGTSLEVVLVDNETGETTTILVPN